jgi:hypothetical protein
MAGNIYSADQDFFDIYQLEIEGDIHDYITGDFTGDRLTDICIIYSPYDNTDERFLGLYFQKSGQSFTAKPDYLVTLPKTAMQIDIADIDNDGKDEILIIDSEGILITWQNGNGMSDLTRIIRENTIFSATLFHGIIVKPFAFNINGHPGVELIIPSGKGFMIFEKGEDGNFRILSLLSQPAICRSSGRNIKDFTGHQLSGINICIASIYCSDGNHDGRNDLYFLWERKLSGYFQDVTGNFSSTPDFEIDFYSPRQNAYIQSKLVDYNGDGSLDLAVSCTSGGLTKTETRIRFYLSNSQGKIDPVFRKELNLSDSHCGLLIADYNFDNKWEMAIPAIELGAMAAAKMLLLKKADMHLLIYPLVNGLPENEPAKRPSFEFQFNFDDPNPTGDVSLNWSSDYNGDLLNDLVFSDGRGNIQFFLGRENEFLSKRPEFEIALDHPAEIHPFHLNGGRYSDIVIEHNLSGKFDRVTILKNRSNKI